MAGKYVRLPAAAERVWGWFWLLDRTRNGNGYAANRITFQDLGHWASLTAVRPQEWELAAILAMDAVRLSAEAGGAIGKPTSDRKLTPALFGAVFGG